MDKTIVCFTYVNYRGKRSERTVRPIRIWLGSTAWYPEVQWLLEAFDITKGETRDFAMAKIQDWREA